jgi:hypothetical protein
MSIAEEAEGVKEEAGGARSGSAPEAEAEALASRQGNGGASSVFGNLARLRYSTAPTQSRCVGCRAGVVWFLAKSQVGHGPPGEI